MRGGDDFPAVQLRLEQGTRRLPDGHVTPDWMRFPVADGEVYIDRDARTALIRAPRPPTVDEVAHPWLARVATAFGRWHGREVLHGGAIEVDGAAWAVLGERGAGKSSLLAWIAMQQLGLVLSDDVLVVEGEDVLAGPRCVDLRADAAAFLGAPAAGDGRPGRVRVGLPPAPARTPLRGIFHLGIGSPPAVESVPVSQRIERLRRHAPAPVLRVGELALLELATLPTYELRRPWDLAALPATAERLLDVLHR